jgi:uncharacterized membrane protein
MNAMRLLSGVVSIGVPAGLILIALVEPMLWPRGTSTFDVLLVILAFLGLAAMVGFMWHAKRSNAVPSQKRDLWVWVLLLGNVFALPFFWFWYVRGQTQSN